MLEHHRTLREGVVAGALAATAVAIWFLLLDTVAGRPLATPSMLGASLSSLFEMPGTPSTAASVLGYTAFHFAAFAVAGLIGATVMNNAEEEPSVLIGFFILFIAFEIGWYGLSAILARSEFFGQLAWYQVFVANLIAAGTIGTYLFRRHPGLATRFAHSLAGDEG
jgi:uncharacterized membrane protein